MSQHSLLGTSIYADFSTILCISVLVELSEITGKHFDLPQVPSICSLLRENCPFSNNLLP